MTEKFRKRIINEVLGYTDDEVEEIKSTCDSYDTCECCPYNRCCLFDDDYLVYCLDEAFR